MINLAEVRINNIVKSKTLGVCRIVAIAPPNVLFESYEGMTVKSDVRDLEPVILTEELLQELDFIYKPTRGVWIRDGFELFEINNQFFLVLKPDIIISSVHQLQNLYFYLTGKELSK